MSLPDDTATPAHLALAAAAPAWHLAGSLVALRDAINHHWPKRDHASDGTIGDERHQAAGSASDHNPWLNHTVRALDVDVDGINAPWLAEQLRIAGMHGDPRLIGGGYVIFDGKQTAPDFSHWVHYDGDPHTSHVHVSASRTPVGYEYSGPWQFLAITPGPAQHPQPIPVPRPAPVHVPDVTPTGHDATGTGDSFRAELGDAGPKVRDLEAELRRYAPAYADDLKVDGVYGRDDARVLDEYAQRTSLEADTPRADRQGLHDADGLNVGPRLARALHHDGLI